MRITGALLLCMVGCVAPSDAQLGLGKVNDTSSAEWTAEVQFVGYKDGREVGRARLFDLSAYKAKKAISQALLTLPHTANGFFTLDGVPPATQTDFDRWPRPLLQPFGGGVTANLTAAAARQQGEWLFVFVGDAVPDSWAPAVDESEEWSLAVEAAGCEQHCTGTAQSCGAYSVEATCSSHTAVGCSWSTQGGCTGVHTACETFSPTAAECSNADAAVVASTGNHGCVHMPDSCTNKAGFTCTSFASNQACTDNDCSWNDQSDVCHNSNANCGALGQTACEADNACSWQVTANGFCSGPSCTLSGQTCGASPPPGCSYACSGSTACSNFNYPSCPAGCSTPCTGTIKCVDLKPDGTCKKAGCAETICGKDGYASADECKKGGCTVFDKAACDKIQVVAANSDVAKRNCLDQYACDGQPKQVSAGGCTGQIPDCAKQQTQAECERLKDTCTWGGPTFVCQGDGSNQFICGTCGGGTFSCAKNDGCANQIPGCDFTCGSSTVSCNGINGCANSYPGCSGSCSGSNCSGRAQGSCTGSCSWNNGSGVCNEPDCSDAQNCNGPACFLTSTSAGCVPSPRTNYDNCSGKALSACQDAAFCNASPAKCATLSNGGMDCAVLDHASCSAEENLGCHWADNACLGAVKACSTITTAAECTETTAPGCAWTGGCAAPVAPVLSGITLTPNDDGTGFTAQVLYKQEAGKAPKRNFPTVTITGQGPLSMWPATAGQSITDGALYTFVSDKVIVGANPTVCFDATDTLDTAAEQVCVSAQSLQALFRAPTFILRGSTLMCGTVDLATWWVLAAVLLYINARKLARSRTKDRSRTRVRNTLPSSRGS